MSQVLRLTIDEIANNSGTEMPHMRPDALGTLHATLLQLRVNEAYQEYEKFALQSIEALIERFQALVEKCMYPGNPQPYSQDSFLSLTPIADSAKRGKTMGEQDINTMYTMIAGKIIDRRDELAPLALDLHTIAGIYDAHKMETSKRMCEVMHTIVTAADETYKTQESEEVILKHMQSRPSLREALKGIVNGDEKILTKLRIKMAKDKDSSELRELVVHGLIQYVPGIPELSIRNYFATESGRRIANL